VRLSGLFLRQGAAVLLGLAVYAVAPGALPLAYTLGAAAGLVGTVFFLERLRRAANDPPARAVRRMGASFLPRAAVIGLALLILRPTAPGPVFVFLAGYFVTQAILWTSSGRLFEEGSG
jgi:formate-dependent nitrite reductase membrane component NrfD